MDVAVLADSANVKYVSSFVVPYWTGWIGMYRGQRSFSCAMEMTFTFCMIYYKIKRTCRQKRERRYGTEKKLQKKR